MPAMKYPGYRLRHLPRLDLRRTIAADDDLAGLRGHRLAILLTARTVVDDQSLSGRDDLRRRPVVAIDNVDLDVAILARKVQDEPHVRRPEGIEGLIVVADRPQ